MICMAGQNQQNLNNPCFYELLPPEHTLVIPLCTVRGTFTGQCACRSTTIFNVSLYRSIIICKSDEAMNHVRTPLQAELVKEWANPTTCECSERRWDPCSSKMKWILKRGKNRNKTKSENSNTSTFSSFSCSRKETENNLVDLNEYRWKWEAIIEGALVHSSDQSVQAKSRDPVS